MEEYTIGRGEMEDLLILLISPAMSCLIKSFIHKFIHLKEFKLKTGSDDIANINNAIQIA